MPVHLRRVLVQSKYWSPRMDLRLGYSIPIVVAGLDCTQRLAGLVQAGTLLGLSRLDDSMVSVLVSLAAVWDFALHEMAVRLVNNPTPVAPTSRGRERGRGGGRGRGRGRGDSSRDN